MKVGTAALAALLAVRFANAQTISIEDDEPKSTLVVPEHKVTRTASSSERTPVLHSIDASAFPR